MAIIRDRAALLDATEQDLRDTYIAFTGNEPPPLSAAALRVAADIALMAASDAAGHLGVPKGTRTPAPITAAELRARTSHNVAGPNPGAQAGDASQQRPHRSDPMASTTKKADKKASAPTKKADKKAAAAKAERLSQTAVFKLGTGEPTSTVRPASRRGAVLTFLAEQPGKKATVEAVLAAVEGANVGDLRVLEHFGHIERAA